MKTKSLFRLSILFLIIQGCGFLLSGAVAQSGEIRGTVRDARTSEGVIGATVVIKGTFTGTSTDVSGVFSLKNVPAGECVLEISSIGYKSEELKLGGTPSGPFEILLESEDIAIGEVYVTARRRSDTENAMVGTVRTLSQVASGVSANQISKSSDRDASEVIRRIPGITIVNDRFINVRGLGQRYNNAWINGMGVPSTETDSRSFSFDLIPSSQIDNMLVYKSPSPEIPGDFSGGFVKITTKGVPDQNSLSVGYTTGVNVKTHFSNDEFRLNPGSGTDFLGFDGNKRPLKSSFPSHMSLVTDPEKITQLTRNGFNNDWRIKNVTALPDQRFSFSLARRFETKSGKTIGNFTAVNYSNTFKGVEGIMNARYGIYSASADKPIHLDLYVDNQYSNDVRVGVMHNWSFVLNPSARIEFKNLLNILGRNRLTERSGYKDESSLYYKAETEMFYSSRLAYSGQLTGIHNLDANRVLDWSAGYSYADKKEPDRRIVTNQAGAGSMDDVPAVVPNEEIKRYFQDLYEHNVSFSGNYKNTFPAGRLTPVLKAGIYGEYQKRDYTPREFIYRYDNLANLGVDNYLTLPFQEMLSEQYLGADKVYIEELNRKTNAYQAEVLHGAAYGALEVTVFDKLDIYAGVRLENHNVRMTRDDADSPTLFIIKHKTTNDLDLLPSANLTYRFNEKHQLRAAYGRSLNRPEVRETSPMKYYDFDMFSWIAGNDELKTAYIQNADLRYEFYPSYGETISIGLFYKHFKNPIEWTFIDSGGTLTYQYENAHKAEAWGVELDVRKNLGFMGLKDFLLVLNASWIDSKVKFRPGEVMVEPDREMQGQSPYIINTGLFYQSEHLGLNMSLLYNRIGKRIVGLGKSNSVEHDINSIIPDSYEMPRDQLDFTVSKQIGKRWEIRCTVRDILSQDIVYKQFPKFEKDGVVHKREQVTRRYNPGQSVTLGASIKF